jgi:hypothetical protein
VALYRRGWNVRLDLLGNNLRLGIGVVIVPAIQPGRVHQSHAIHKVEVVLYFGIFVASKMGNA